MTCTPKNRRSLDGEMMVEGEVDEMVAVGWLLPLWGEEMQQSHSMAIVSFDGGLK